MKRLVAVLSALLLAAPNSARAQSQVVGAGGSVQMGGNPGWLTWIQATGYAEVTTTRPRMGWGDVGTGSLELRTNSLSDWAFWYHYAGGTAAQSMANLNAGGAFGALHALTELSFDWFRVGLPNWDTPCGTGDQPMPPCDWAYKTPVVRLQLAEQIGDVLVQTELIWEGYFNQQQLGGIGGVTPVNQWVTTTNMHQGNFWYIRPALGAGADPAYTTIGSGTCNLNPFTFWQGNASASALAQLLGQGGCMSETNPMVIGIAVGVGSQWPLDYHGFADNVRMGFDGERMLDTNFDAVVPEPSSLLLLGVGLVGLGVIGKRRRR